MSASYDSNLDDLFRALGWRRLYYQRLEQKSVLMYKTLHGTTPEDPRSRFVYHDNKCFSFKEYGKQIILTEVFCTAELTCGTTYP